MNVKRKIKAFTLIELMMALVISSLVISVAYGVYATTQKTFERQKKAADKISRLLTLQDMLRFDLTLGKEARRLSGSVILIEGNDFNIFYKFNSGGVVRRVKNHADTLQVGTSELTTSFYGKNASSGIFNKLSVHLTQDEKSRVFSFYKTYGAAVKMNRLEH